MSRTLLRFAPAAALAALAAPLAQAADLDTINLLTQREFRQLSEDVAAATSFKPLTGAAPGGVTGFDIGVTLTATELAHRGVWRKAAGGASVPDVVPVLGLRAHKGLPLNLDVGVFYNTLPDSNVRATGGEIRWAALPGNAVLPAVAFRLSASKARLPRPRPTLAPAKSLVWVKLSLRRSGAPRADERTCTWPTPA
jgi:hypothetical protein